MKFETTSRDGAARRGRLALARGVVATPAFMPVGTYGSVKGVTPEELVACGAEIILANTFHLMLRPGPEVVRAHGGLDVVVDAVLERHGNGEWGIGIPGSKKKTGSGFNPNPDSRFPNPGF
jgi:hypothetical protein